VDYHVGGWIYPWKKKELKRTVGKQDIHQAGMQGQYTRCVCGRKASGVQSGEFSVLHCDTTGNLYTPHGWHGQEPVLILFYIYIYHDPSLTFTSTFLSSLDMPSILRTSQCSCSFTGFLILEVSLNSWPACGLPYLISAPRSVFINSTSIPCLVV
jgi:hypothetical protein